MTTAKKTLVVRVGDRVVAVTARSSEFLPLTKSVGATTGHSIAHPAASVATVSSVGAIDSPPVGYRVTSVASNGRATSLNSGHVVRSLSDNKLNIIVRPQVLERELSTERLNKAVQLGYMPPRQTTKG